MVMFWQFTGSTETEKKKALLAPKSEEDMECGIHKAGILY